MMKLQKALLGSFRNKPRSEGYYRVGESELASVKYADMCISPPENIYIMRRFNEGGLADLFTKQLSEEQRYYAENGYLILRDFIPHDLIDNYLALRESLSMGRDQFVQAQVPHVQYQDIRDIACYGPMIDMLRHLHSMEMGLIFSLTGFKSTQRGWHQDSYLDADDAVPRCATWIALGDVTEESGPFEYVPGSNKWPALSNQKINTYLDPQYGWPHAHRASIKGAPRWGKLCEKFINPSVDKKIAAEKHTLKQFVAGKGDLLIWYGRLMHRGSAPADPKSTRPALISHYAPIGERERGLFAKRKDNAYFLVPPASFAYLEGHTDLL